MFFMIGVFPICAVFASRAILLAVDVLPRISSGSNAATTLDLYWSALVFFAIAGAGLATGAEYLLTGRSFDKLTPRYASEAVLLVKQIEDEELLAKGETEQAALEKKRINARNAFEQFSKMPSLERLERLPPRAHLRALLDRNIQIQLRLAAPRVLLAAQVQIFLGGLVFLLLVQCCGWAAYIANTSSLDGAGKEVIGQIYRSAFTALLLLLIHPITFNAYKSRMDAVVSPPLPLPGSTMIIVAVVLVLGFLLALDPAKQSTDLIAILSKAAPAGTALALLFASKLKDGEIVHRLVGWEANMGSMIFVVVFLWTLSSAYVFFPVKLAA